MMVAEISNLTPCAIWWNLDLVEGKHYVALWWEKRQVPLVRAQASSPLSRLTV